MKFILPFLAWTLIGSLLSSCQISPKNSAIRSLDRLRPGQELSSFRLNHVIVGPSNQPFAAEFEHTRFGFKTYLLLVDTAPQSALWFETIPTSNKGEAHALEHVVLTKGKSGKTLSLMYDMELGRDSATTHADFTFYHFYSQSGENSFMKLFAQNLKMLFQPEFTAQDIEREVFHFGTEGEPGSLRLVEKGTVYNEMNSRHGYWQNWYAMLENLFGPNHYARLRSGGEPKALRQMTAADVEKYHRDNYRLDNGFGTILVAPPSTNLERYFQRISKIFSETAARLPEWQKTLRTRVEYEIQPSSTKEPKIFEYAGNNPEETSSLLLAWSPIQDYKNYESVDFFRLNLFLTNFAKGSDSVLYQKMISRQTRDRDYHVDSVWLGTNDDLSAPFIYGSLGGLAPSLLTPRRMENLRSKILRELEDVTRWQPNSPELKRFNDRAQAYLQILIRSQKGMLDQPPGFGFRGTKESWKTTFQFLARKEGERKHFISQEDTDRLLGELQSGENIWKKSIEDFRLLQTPYINAKKVSTKKLAEVEEGRTRRRQAKENQLKKKHSTNDLQQALALFKKEQDQITQEITQRMTLDKKPRFSESPPMNYDPLVESEQKVIWGNVSLTTTEFANTPKISFGLANNLLVFSPEEYIYLPLMRHLIDTVGLREGDKVTPYDQMYKEMREKILGVSFGYDSHSFEDRESIHDFTLSLSALTIEEMRESLHYWQRILKYNDLSSENLPRIRDLVDRSLSSLRRSRSGRAEDWLKSLSYAYFYQYRDISYQTGVAAALLHTYYRYRWWLKEPPSAQDLASFKKFSMRLRRELKASNDLEEFSQRLKALSAPDNLQALKEELEGRVFELSPNFREEVPFLLDLIESDWQVAPIAVLTKLREMQNRLFHRGNMSGYLVADAQNMKAALKELKNWSELFPDIQPPTYKESQTWTIDQNIQRRLPKMDPSYPRYVGFHYPDTTNAHVVAISRGMNYENATEDELLEGLSITMLSGGAPHGVFMKTSQEGLAYSNGISINEVRGRMRYYAERSPNMALLLRFVHQVASDREAVADPSLTEYALAQFFSGSRQLNSPASRGYAQYQEVRSGRTSAKTEEFRRRLLQLRSRKDLHVQLVKKMPDVATRLLVHPQYFPTQRWYKSQFFFVGPSPQLEAVDQMIGDKELTLIYPSDYWIR